MTSEVSEKEERKGKLSRSVIPGISSSCDDLLEEKLATGTNEPIGLITQAETQRPLSKESEHGSPVKGSGKKGRRRKISMPWFRQSSFGVGLQKLRLPKQHTIASSDSNPPVPYHPVDGGARASSSSELLHRNVRHNFLLVRLMFYSAFPRILN